MVKINTRALFTLLLFSSIPFLSSCFSTRVRSNVEGAVVGIEVNGLPVTNYFGPALITPVDSNGVIFCQLLSETDMRIERYDNKLQGRWSTPIRLSAKDAPLGYIDETAPPPGKEMPFHMTFNTFAKEWGQNIYVTKNHAVFLTTIRGEDDSVCLMGRYFDLATGKHLETKMIHSSLRSETLPEYLQYYNMAFSSDSSRLLFYLARHGDQVNQMNLETIILSRDAEKPAIATLILPVSTDASEFMGAIIDNAGHIYAAKSRSDSSISLTRFEAPALTRDKELDAPIRRPDGSLADIQALTIHPSEDGSAVALIADRKKKELAGVMGFRFDFKAGKIIPGNYLAIDEKLLETTIHDDELEEPALIGHLSSPSHGRYVLIFEEQYDGYQTSVTGNVLAIGFDETMNPKWTVGIEKKQKMNDVLTYSFMSCASRISPGGVLQIVYQNDGHLSMHEFSVADGKPATVAPNGRHLLEMGELAFAYLPSFTWLGDDALLFHVPSVIFSPRPGVYRVATR